MNALHKIRKMLAHDLSAGLRQCAGFYPIVVLYVLSVCVLFDQKFSRWATMQPTVEKVPAISDYLTYLFQGMEVYQINPQNGFRLPAIWMMIFLLFVLSVAKYPQSDLYGIGQHLLLKSGSRTAWWVAKLVWTFACAVLYNLICLVTILLYVAFAHGVQWHPCDFTVATLPGLAACSTTETVLWLVVLPIVTMCALGGLELLIGVIVAPVVGVIAMVSILLAALYFNITLLPGGTCILLRSVLAVPDGFHLGSALGISGTGFLLCAAVGDRLFQRLNLYKNREG